MVEKNAYWYGREWPYKNIKPKIVCEKFLSNDSGDVLDDHKVLCFNEKAKLIQHNQERFKLHTIDNYDLNWNRTTVQQVD